MPSSPELKLVFPILLFYVFTTFTGIIAHPANTVLPFASNSSTSPLLANSEITCLSHGSRALSLQTCLSALYTTAREPPASLYLPKFFRTVFETSSEGMTVPQIWKAGRKTQECYMVLGSIYKMDKEAFSVAGIAFFGSLVVQQCIMGQKEGWGGRFTIGQGGFYVDITGEMPDAGEDHMHGEVEELDVQR